MNLESESIISHEKTDSAKRGASSNNKLLLLQLLNRSLNELLENRMSPVRSGLELGVILDTEIELVAGDLHFLNE